MSIYEINKNLAQMLKGGVIIVIKVIIILFLLLQFQAYWIILLF